MTEQIDLMFTSTLEDMRGLEVATTRWPGRACSALSCRRHVELIDAQLGSRRSGRVDHHAGR